MASVPCCAGIADHHPDMSVRAVIGYSASGGLFAQIGTTSFAPLLTAFIYWCRSPAGLRSSARVGGHFERRLTHNGRGVERLPDCVPAMCSRPEPPPPNTNT